ncbi:MAG: putative Fe-S protein YdhL (DUF1289 family) [Alteromonadaceae bacterium]|jgi:predicted Fe-S protein YdhL (DUF1289 family)|tara:strand:+ start:1935 stop:2255 length:321 start_codon:yes stop_codon:yes gene_type:complete
MQLEFFDVPSPCVSVCQTDDKGLCLGCFRKRDERLNWLNFTSDDKQKVIKRCKQRKKRKESLLKAKITDTASETELLKLLQPSLLDPPIKSKAEGTTDLDFSDFEL